MEEIKEILYHFINLPQMCHDIACGGYCYTGLSKTPEFMLMWLLMFLGCFTIIVLVTLWYRKKELIVAIKLKLEKSIKNFIVAVKVKLESDISFVFVALLCLGSIYLVYGDFYRVYIFIVLSYVVLSYNKPDLKIKGTLLIFFIYAFFISVSSMGCVLFSFWETDQELIQISTILTGLLILTTMCFSRSPGTEKLIGRAILLIQLIFPFLLAIYFQNRYIYDGNTLYITFSMGYYLFMGGIILVLLMIAIINCIKNWNKEFTSSSFIFVSTIIAIFIFRGFWAPDMIFPKDLWHAGECILPWQQVVDLGQKLYVNCFPTSGLIPMVDGFFLNIILSGTTTEFHMAIVLFRTTILLFVILLCNCYLGKIWTLIIALTLSVSASRFWGLLFGYVPYERTYLIFPSLLILFLPTIVKQRSLWLKIWVLLCLANFLYYPLYGGAIGFGTLPFALVQVYKFFKTGEWDRKKRDSFFYLSWFCCLLPAIFFTPLILKILQRTKDLAAITLEMEGHPLLGTLIYRKYEELSYLFPILNSFGSIGKYFKIFILYCTNMYLSLFLVFCACFCLMLFFFKNSEKKLLEKLQNPFFLGLMAVIIVTMVSYTYTQVCTISYILLVRSAFVITFLSTFFIILLLKYTKNEVFSIKIKNILLSLMLSGMVLSINEPFDAKSLRANIPLDKNEFVLVDDELLKEVPRVGRGFIRIDQKNELLFLKFVSERTKRSIVLDKDLLLFYTLNISYPGGYLPAIVTKSLQDKNILIYEKELPVLYRYYSIRDYCIYHWFMVDKKYQKGPDNFWLPLEELKKIYGENFSHQDAREEFSPGTLYSLEFIPNSYGRSIKSLEKLFTEVSVKTMIFPQDLDSITKTKYKSIGERAAIKYFFQTPVYGDNADFVYLRFKTNEKSFDEKEVWVTWETADNFPAPIIICKFRYDGSFLIPMGAYTGWLLSSNTSITFGFDKFLSKGDTISIEEIKFLKLDTKVGERKDE
jgi:hypothetical protein